MATGSCLCGGVRYGVVGEIRDVWQCHCSRCQKITGNFMAASGCAASQLTLEAAETLAWYSPDDDPGVAYGFCSRCGSSLFWRVLSPRADDHWSICAGTFDDVEPLTTTKAWFSDQMAAHTAVPPGVELISSDDLR